MDSQNTKMQKLIAKYLRQKTTKEESQIVENWYDQLDEDDVMAKKNWTDKQQMLKASIDGQIRKKNIMLKPTVWLRVAAAILILFGATMFYIKSNPKLVTKDQLLKYATINSVDLNQLKNTRLIVDQIDSIDLTGSASITHGQDALLVKNGEESKIQKISTHQNAFSTLAVPYGRRAELMLADGTKVWLNSGTQITYPNQFDGESREVFVTGEAYFQVAHNKEKPFHVYAKGLNVQVLGTSFNVRAYKDDKQVSTTLVEGSVALSYGDEKSGTIKLTPGKTAVYEFDKKFTVNASDTEVVTSWHLGYLSLKNEPLISVLKTIKRYYNVSIVIEDDVDQTRSFSGRLSLQPNVKDVIDVIALSTGHQVEQAERGWVIRK